MKPVTRLLVLLIFVSGTVRNQARAGEVQPGSKRPAVARAEALPEFLRVYDVDGNGILSEEERQVASDVRNERRHAVTGEWDTDADGILSDAERQAAREELRRRIEEKRLSRFEEADRNGDGSISEIEFRAIPAISRLDRDKVEGALEKLDSNRDGMIGKEEFLSALREVRPVPVARDEDDSSGRRTPVAAPRR